MRLYRPCAMERSMNERLDRPVSREELVSTIRMALFKARRLWPKARPGDHDRPKPMAAAVADHLALCGMRCVGKDPGIGPSASDLCPELRRDAASGDPNEPDRDGRGPPGRSNRA